MGENNKNTASSFRQVLRTSPMDFWRLWYVGFVVTTVRWLETVAMGIVVYQQTGSALVVAMVTMLRLVPMGLFGAFLGAFAERFDRRLTLAGIVGLMMVTSALLSVVAFRGALEVWHLAVAAFINGCGWATDNPLRRVMMGEVMGRDRLAIARDLERCYALFPRLAERRQQLAGSLSGGEQQMLAIGRSLMARPTLLMLDEPSLGLAPKLVAEMMATLDQLHQDGLTILLVEQNAHAALAIADRAVVIEAGHVTISGRAADLLADPSLQNAYLGR